MAAWNTAAETSQMVTLPCGAEPYQTVGKTNSAVGYTYISASLSATAGRRKLFFIQH